jgi:signal transduction histidine kinase
VAIFATGIHRRAMRALVAERDERAAASAASSVNETLESRLLILDLVMAPAFSESPSRYLDNFDQEFLRAFPQGVAVFDRDGSLLTAVGPSLEDETLLHEVQSGGVGSIATADLDGERVVLLVASDGDLTIVGAILMRDLLTSAVPSITSVSGDSSMYLVGPESHLLLATGSIAPSNLRKHAGVQAVLRGERGSSFLPMADGEHVVAFAPIPSAGWGLIVEEPWETVTSSVLDLSLLAPFSLAPILALALLGLWFGARRVVEPLRRLEEAASELPSGGSEVIERPVGGIAEIEQLRSTLAHMSKRVSEAQSALRAYIGVITNAQEEERRRIAREIHDESIQHWIALDHRLQMAVGRLRQQDNPDADLLEELHQDVQKGVQELRRLSRGLRPIYLEDLGLVPAIEMLARDHQISLGIPVEFVAKGEEARLSADVELALYRLVQEGLANIGRHAGATRANITLTFQVESLQLTLEDYGRGFEPPEQFEQLAMSGHYGLMGMRERADAIGGQLVITSSPGAGTKIQLSVPVRRGEEQR